MGFLQRGGIGDTLTPLCTRKGIADERRRTDKALLHGGSGLESNEVIHEGCINTATKRTEGLGEHTVGLRGIALIVAEATSLHDGQVGAHARADLLIGGTQFMLEQC